MAYIETTICVYTKSGAEYELTVCAEGDVTEGGSNSYGSDEPKWAEVDNVALSCPITGRPVGKRILAAIPAKQWEAIETALFEDHQSY